MARYQSLPDRIDTFCTTVNDQTMCVNYGLVNDCCIIAANGKCQLNVFGATSCCAWTVPPGVSSIFVELWGAGAGGTGGATGATSGIGGGSGAYTSATIPTFPGCIYIVCSGVAGVGGAGVVGTVGSPAFMTGYNITGLCAAGGTAGGAVTTTGLNGPAVAAASSPSICASTVGKGSNLFAIPGTGGMAMAAGVGTFQSRGGSAPFNGGIGGINMCANAIASPAFPGAGGAGGNAASTTGGSGASGLIRIWY